MSKKPEPSRTTNRLHFEDLDPYRFEDLVRQLIHNFRRWTQIEALGRSGADEGIDIRAVEAYLNLAEGSEPLDDDLDNFAGEANLRTWHLQCKREKTIGPKKVLGIADDLSAGEEIPYGVLLVASVDFSKKTRDTFRRAMSERGVVEVHLWGRAELEDRLYRPENDHLLFAYFGISLQVKRRRIATDLRRRLAVKRALAKLFGTPDESKHVYGMLIRDPDEDGYPFRDRVEAWTEDDPPWIEVGFGDWGEPGFLQVVVKHYDAWLELGQKQFDYIPRCNDAARGYNLLHPWEDDPDEAEYCRQLSRFMRSLPDENQARFEIRGWIHYDDILLVDDIGDAWFDPPHILVSRTAQFGFFRYMNGFVVKGYGHGRKVFPAGELKRKKLFPDPLPEVPEEPHPLIDT